MIFFKKTQEKLIWMRLCNVSKLNIKAIWLQGLIFVIQQSGQFVEDPLKEMR